MLANAAVLRFGDFELDLRRGVLSRDGLRLKLQPQPLRVLQCLAESAPSIVSREELGATVWTGVHVDVDLSLNYCIRQIRAVLEDSAANPRFIETLPKQGYRFLGVVSTVAFTTAPAMAHEAEPAGTMGPVWAADRPLALPSDVVSTARRSLRARYGTSGLALLIGMVCLVAALLAGWLLRGRGERAFAPVQSVAVLPLTNLSGDPGQEYLADGMTEELITMLAKHSRLRVISRTTAMGYKHAQRPLRDIARELHVDGIVEGSVARHGDRVHVTVQLIGGPSDTHLWAESYDRAFESLTTVSREVAEDVARVTRTGIAGKAVGTPVNAAAHDAYLRGRYLWFAGQNEAAGAAFRKAIALQPDYALAWSGLSSYYGAGALSEQQHELDPREALRLQEDAARRAVRFDDTLGDGHLSLGAALFFHQWAWAEAEAEIDRAIALDPNLAQAYHFRAKILFALDRSEEALTAERTADELDPFGRPWAMTAAFLWARRYPEALNEVQEKLRASPRNAFLEEMLSDVLLDLHRGDEYAAALARWMDDAGQPAAGAAVRAAYRNGGVEAVYRWQLGDLERRRATEYVSPMDFAKAEATLGRKEATLAALEEGYRQRSPSLIWLQQTAALDFLHGEPRYRALVAKMGLPPAYGGAGELSGAP